MADGISPVVSRGNRRQARENARDQLVIVFGFPPDWLRRWRVFFLKPIIERYGSKAKPKEFSDALSTVI